MALIINSVGVNGRNNKYDIYLIQGLLKEAGFQNSVNGRADTNLFDAVKAFQKDKLKDYRPSGFIEPNGPTLGALSVYANKTYFKLKDNSVSIGSTIISKLNEIAAQFYYCSGSVITITDGTRSAANQAAVMFIKLDLGENILRLYRDTNSAREIADKYSELKNLGKTSDDIRSGMEQVVANQMANNIYISKHLRAGAVDIRSRGLTQKTDLIMIIRQFGVLVLDEGVPPHLHLQF